MGARGGEIATMGQGERSQVVDQMLPFAEVAPCKSRSYRPAAADSGGRMGQSLDEIAAPDFRMLEKSANLN